MTSIDYHKVSHAISLYAEKGYKYVDTPWYVGAAALKATLPRERYGFCMWHPELPTDKFLVGSAEQGFLQMMQRAEIGPGTYCSAGPCFRDEPVVDDLHQYSFFKLELIKIYDAKEQPEQLDVYMMGHTAHRVHGDLLWLNEEQKRRMKVVRTEIGYDLTLGGIEIGSYGLREVDGHRWLYGTGLALPRAQIARERVKV